MITCTKFEIKGKRKKYKGNNLSIKLGRYKLSFNMITFNGSWNFKIEITNWSE